MLAWIQGFAESLGGSGLFIIAFLDSSFLSFPEASDALIVLLTVQHPERMVFYALTTTIGSVAGCYALYTVGRRGGEAFLRKRFHERHIDRAMETFRRHGMLSVLVPSLLPPPMPFKIFVLSSGVFGVPFRRFAATLVVARGLRYVFWGAMGAAYGDEALALLKRVDGWFDERAGVLLGVTVALVVVGLALYYALRRPGRPSGGPLL